MKSGVLCGLLFFLCCHQTLLVAQKEVGCVEYLVQETVTEGTFTDTYYQQVFDGLPPFRRVAAVLHPVPGSNIGVEVWMPVDGWNGRFLGTGNGGGAGKIGYSNMVNGLKRGFAVANTDMGTAPAAHLHHNNPEVWKDFGYRATHEMTVFAKQVIEVYYGKAPAYSYFQGCSTGGQQALSEAQRYPDDYDGILAGAPANNRTHLHAMFLWCHALGRGDESCTFTDECLQQMAEAAVEKNRGHDGGAPTDRFLTDPREAVVPWEVLDTLLTPRQRDVWKKLADGPVNPRTGDRIYCPFPLNSEDKPLGPAYFRRRESHDELFYPFIWAFGENFDCRKFDFDTDMAFVDSLLAPVLNANNPDLEALKQRGGKIIMYTGTCDAIVPFQDAVHYYERVIQEMGGLQAVQEFFRYFIVPGMTHCGGGPGVNEFGQGILPQPHPNEEQDVLALLMKWVEQGMPPDRILATRYMDDGSGRVEMQRPLYPYPQFPVYQGGDAAEPGNYKPMPRARGNVPAPADRYVK